MNQTATCYTIQATEDKFETAELTVARPDQRLAVLEMVDFMNRTYPHYRFWSNRLDEQNGHYEIVIAYRAGSLDGGVYDKLAARAGGFLDGFVACQKAASLGVKI
jgi:hypothetical protein